MLKIKLVPDGYQLNRLQKIKESTGRLLITDLVTEPKLNNLPTLVSALV
jgi:hypothetical protein